MTITRLYGDLTDLCLSIFDAGAPRQPVEIAERLMDCESVAMHCPEHHFIVPAALLTATRLAQGAPREALEKDLSLAAQRASKVAGGFCGSWGCCGAAVGCGIFAAVLTGALLSGRGLLPAARQAADFVRACIAATEAEGIDRLQGVQFERQLRRLWESA